MSGFVALTEVSFCHVNIDASNTHQLYFSNLSEQTNFFNSIKEHTMNNCSYQRADSYIRVNLKYDDLLRYNYVIYKNANYSNKIFYAFITDIRYENPNCSLVYIKTDVWQTWCFNVNLKPCFVEREMIENDTIGANIVEENLELGDFVYDDKKNTGHLNDIWYVACYTILRDSDDYVFGDTYDNQFSGLKMVAFDNGAALKAWLISMTMAAYADSIEYIFTCPSMCLPASQQSGGEIPNGATSQIIEISEEFNFTTIDGYTPKNKKLFTYPYNFLYASNNVGGACVYRFEDFQSPGEMQFFMLGHMEASPTILLVPRNFKKQAMNIEESLSLNNAYPLCSWSSETFSTWLAQNKNQLITQGATTAIGGTLGYAGSMGALIGGLVAGTSIAMPMIGAITTAVSTGFGIQSLLNRYSLAEMQPRSSKG